MFQIDVQYVTAQKREPRLLQVISIDARSFIFNTQISTVKMCLYVLRRMKKGGGGGNCHRLLENTEWCVVSKSRYNNKSVYGNRRNRKRHGVLLGEAIEVH